MTQNTVRGIGANPPIPAGGWSLVLPLKPLALAKTRLAPYAGALRPGLALAFALDTVTAALRCGTVRRVLVVTDDPVAGEQLAALGALVVRGEPGTGLNSALAFGAARARRIEPYCPVAALSADLPALRADELARVLAAVPGAGRAFLADTQRVGTTLLAAAPDSELRPAFGGASRARHRAGGAREITLPDVDSVRRDVDTGADLAEALALGLGPRTAALAASLV